MGSGRKGVDSFVAENVGNLVTNEFMYSGTQTSTEKPTEKTLLHSDWLLTIFSVFFVLSFLFGFEANRSERTEKTEKYGSCCVLPHPRYCQHPLLS